MFDNLHFPSAEQLWLHKLFEEFSPLLPAALIPVPKVAGGRGHRIRMRLQSKRDLVLSANQKLRALNLLDSGIRPNNMQTLKEREWRADTSLLDPKNALSSIMCVY